MVYFGCDSMSLTTTLKVQGHNDLIKAHAMNEATFIRSTGDSAVDMRAE